VCRNVDRGGACRGVGHDDGRGESRVGGVEHGDALRLRHAQLFHPRLIDHRTASRGKILLFQKWAFGLATLCGLSIDGSGVSHEVPSRELE
jgi:hypothetical protein